MHALHFNEMIRRTRRGSDREARGFFSIPQAHEGQILHPHRLLTRRIGPFFLMIWSVQWFHPWIHGNFAVRESNSWEAAI
ncbi:hypothetical protein BDW59DRAFT_141134 [Aspergillus cavernicola]|uniref:Uncharacterized protein n=1 Tax=Aspergillus cavernicola TaxID=176166 RepID=A0ABR4IS36_9EURO